MTDDLLDAFAVAGSPAEASDLIAAYEDANVDMPVAYVPTTAPPDLIRETIEWFADA